MSGGRSENQSEKAILNDCLVELSSQPETLVFRNNTGMAWQGKKAEARVGSRIEVEPGMVILRDARPVKFGLKGSGDILGAHGGRPIAVEVKDAHGRQTEDQKRFESAWTRAGGIYLLVRSPEEMLKRLAVLTLLG